MRRLAVLAALATAPVVASAEDRPVEPSTVEATLVGTNVRMSARFVLAIEGPGVALHMESIAIPARGVVTAASLVVAGKRHRMQLEKADVAAGDFDALTLKPGRDGDRAWAFVVSGGQEAVTVDVLAPHAARVELELTLDVPTCFYNDARFVELPPSWWEHVPAAQRTAVRVTDADVAAACNREELEDSVRWLGLPSRHLAKQPAGARRLGVIAGRLPLDEKHVARVELDVARELTRVSADLHTAIVIDHSRSLTSDELEAQRAIVAAYVRAAPASRVQVIGYARRAAPLLPSWMMASHAAPRIDREIRALAQRNGSNLDAALAAAGAWLARVDGTRRVVLFSDERLAERLAALPAEHLRALLPAGTLVHVVRPAVFPLVREDEGALGKLAELTQGIAVTGGGDEDGRVDAMQLVRPTSLDRLEIGAPGWRPVEGFDERACEDSLREGHTCTFWAEGSAAAGPLTIRARMWNTPIERVVRADPAQARTLARILSVGQLFDAELQEEIDRIALAVNSVWSLFAQWGGDGGYEDLGGFGTIGLGRFGTSSHDHAIGHGPIGRGMAPLDLRQQLQPALATCRAGEARVTITVETTREEIVDVGVATDDAKLRDCLVEAVWDLTLRIANAPGHATTRVAFGNKR